MLCPGRLRAFAGMHLDGQAVGSGSSAATVIRARVVREAPNGIGVQFLYFDKAERKTLENFLQSIADAQPS
jgi:hypothetical protein